MEITPTLRAEYFEIKLKGRMDAVWSDHVAKALADCVRGGQHTIAVDMAEVDYISSAGIRTLVLYARQLKNIQGLFGVINASPNVKKVLELAGLGGLLKAHDQLTAAKTTVVEEATIKVTFAQPGATAELFSLHSKAGLRARWHGQPEPWLQGSQEPLSCSVAQFPSNTMGIGLGAFGEDSGNIGKLGEFLAAAGVAVCQPADGSNRPDYMLQRGALTPSINIGYGMIAEGEFSRLMRFDKGPQNASLPLSDVARACLDSVQADAAGIVMVAETSVLVGALLQKAPAADPAERANIFTFPGVRDWLSFTSEAAFADSTCLIVGFAARGEQAKKLNLLKPLLSSGELSGHFHAAAFPYRPLRKGKVELDQAIHPLFEGERVLGMLHLLNDWRSVNGAGESRFLRGACWCSPLVS